MQKRWRDPSALFQEEFAESDVITKWRAVEARWQFGMHLWGRPSPSLYRELLGWLNDASKDISQLKDILQDAGNLAHKAQEFLATAFHNENLALYQLLKRGSWGPEIVRSVEQGPVDVVDLAYDLFGSMPEAVENMTALVDLCNRARLRSEDNPLPPARYHFLSKPWKGRLLLWLISQRCISSA